MVILGGSRPAPFPLQDFTETVALSTPGSIHNGEHAPGVVGVYYLVGSKPQGVVFNE